MKLGILADIHEQVEYVQRALARFAEERVDQIVVLGDVFEMGERIEETCRLLAEAETVGVWGNHDFGLCVDPDDHVRQKYPTTVVNYMTSLQPRLDIDGCHFTHVEPWLDPQKVLDLWYYDGAPDEQFKLDRIFDAVPNRLMFAGHYHQWLLARPDTIDSWTGQLPICLEHGRYFVVVGAVCDGRYAIFDTTTSELVPFNEGHQRS